MAATVKFLPALFFSRGISSKQGLPGLLISRSNISNAVQRQFLSAAFRCEEAWAERLSEPAIKNMIDPASYFVELDRKFRSEKAFHGVAAVDLDLYANSDIGHDSLGDLEEVLLRFRRTPATVDMLESTTHAVIRHFLKLGQHRVLMRMLDKRVEYGIFSDFYCSSLVMDTFIKQKNYRDAAKVAIHMMLQEESGTPIATHLALYSCLSYLRSPQPEPWDTEPPPPPPEEPSEHIVIRLPYLPPDYFDDHFDLKDPAKLIGKSLAFFGKQFEGELGRTCVLLGYGLYEKWNKVEALCVDALREKKRPAVFKEGVVRVRQVIENIADDEQGTRQTMSDKILPLLGELEELAIDGDAVDVAKELTEAVVKQHEAADIEDQKAVYKRWANVRLDEIERHKDALSREKRIEKISAIKEDLKKREQLLFFFENFELHAMNVEKYDAIAAQVAAAKEKKKGKDKDADEDYVPPDVRRRPSRRTA